MVICLAQEEFSPSGLSEKHESLHGISCHTALRAESGSAPCFIVLSQDGAVRHSEKRALSLELVFSSPCQLTGTHFAGEGSRSHVMSSVVRLKSLPPSLTQIRAVQ